MRDIGSILIAIAGYGFALAFFVSAVTNFLRMRRLPEGSSARRTELSGNALGGFVMAIVIAVIIRWIIG